MYSYFRLLHGLLCQFSMKGHRVSFFSEVIEKANKLIFMNVFIHS